MYRIFLCILFNLLKGTIMKQIFLILSFLFVAATASAATVEYKDDNVTIQLYDTPCVSEKMVAMARTEEDKATIKLYNAAKVSFKGQVLEACWVFDQDHIDIVDEAGQSAENVSPSIFKMVQEI